MFRNAKVNMNGNRKEELEKEIFDLYSDLCDVRDKAQKLTVHGRNYIPQGIGPEFQADRDEKVEFIGKLQALCDQLVEIHQEFNENNS